MFQHVYNFKIAKFLFLYFDKKIIKPVKLENNHHKNNIDYYIMKFILVHLKTYDIMFMHYNILVVLFSIQKFTMLAIF